MAFFPYITTPSIRPFQMKRNVLLMNGLFLLPISQSSTFFMPQAFKSQDFTAGSCRHHRIEFLSTDEPDDIEDPPGERSRINNTTDTQHPPQSCRTAK